MVDATTVHYRGSEESIGVSFTKPVDQIRIGLRIQEFEHTNSTDGITNVSTMLHKVEALVLDVTTSALYLAPNKVHSNVSSL